jgi:hypothetical protein
MMNRTLLVTTTLCTLLAGCFAESPHVKGEKLGPGHCRQPGIAEISILKFKGPPNATITIQITNLYYDRVGGFAWMGIVGNDGMSNNYVGGWDDNREHNWLEPNETSTLSGKIPDLNLSRRDSSLSSGFPTTPWTEVSVFYHYHVGSRDHPTNLECSLVGDNAPWAFETKT